MVTRQKRCEFCGRFFTVDRRLCTRQRSCGRPECRRARKRASQAAWLKKNPDYFKGRSDNTRQWRHAHPGYQQRRRQKIHEIQDSIDSPSPMKSVRLLIPAKWFKYEITPAGYYGERTQTALGIKAEISLHFHRYRYGTVRCMETFADVESMFAVQFAMAPRTSKMIFFACIMIMTNRYFHTTNGSCPFPPSCEVFLRGKNKTIVRYFFNPITVHTENRDNYSGNS